MAGANTLDSVFANQLDRRRSGQRLVPPTPDLAHSAAADALLEVVERTLALVEREVEKGKGKKRREDRHRGAGSKNERGLEQAATRRGIEDGSPIGVAGAHEERRRHGYGADQRDTDDGAHQGVEDEHAVGNHQQPDARHRACPRSGPGVEV